MSKYTVIHEKGPYASTPIKMWDKGIPQDQGAILQLFNTAALPFIYRHVAVMPDYHWGNGSTIGSVVATEGAVVPAAVGVDIGCGMTASQTSLTAADLPDDLSKIRATIEEFVPHGRSDNGGEKDIGAWPEDALPERVENSWCEKLEEEYEEITYRGEFIDGLHKLKHHRPMHQLGTLGTGNHFIEVCLDEEEQVWVVLHSGSRGPGAAIGNRFTRAAIKLMEKWFVQLPDPNLAYFPSGTDEFKAYIKAVNWAQKYAKINRELMLITTVQALSKSLDQEVIFLPKIDCHHNYVSRENHFGKNVWVTRKGATRARVGDMGIIPGSMGAKSYIVTGKGNPESFNSSSHGAGRKMSRRKARELFSVSDHEKATEGVECRKDKSVLDETPGSYKDIDQVMAAQSDLVEVVHTLHQVICVKG